MKTIPATAFLLSVACLAGSTLADGPAPAAPTPHVRLPLGQPAPEILASTPEAQPVTLNSLKGKPTILQFGSLTEPLFRLRTPALEKLAAKYGDKVNFLIVYTRESHAADGPAPLDTNAQDGFDIAAPTSMEERIALAKEALSRLHIKGQTVAVDAWSNTTSLRYGNLPNMTFVIDADGVLQAGYPWMDPKKVQGALDALLAHKPLSSDLRGPVHPGRNPGADYQPIAMEMGGGGAGGGKLAVIIDHMQLSEIEKAAIMPALSQFLVDIRNYRETRTGQPLKLKGAAAAASTAPATGEAKAEELQDEITKLRASAKKLQDVCHDSLPADKAKQILDAVNEGPARRLFADN